MSLYDNTTQTAIGGSGMSGYQDYEANANGTTTVLLTNSTNNTDNTALSMHVSPLVSTIKAIFMLSIIFAAILGNLLVIISVFRFKKLHIISNSFIASLACADLLVASFVMPFSASQEIAGRWLFGQTVCDIFNGNDVLFSTASLMHLCCISIDRYVAVTQPLKYPTRMTKRKVIIMLSIAWGASALISHIPVHTGIYTIPKYRWISNGLCLFIVNKAYAVISSTTSFWIPAIIMVFTYAIVFKEARKQERRIIKQNNDIKQAVAGMVSPLRVQIPDDNQNTHKNRTERLNDIKRNESLESLDAQNGELLGLNGQADNGNVGLMQRRWSREKKAIRRENKAAKTLGIIMSVFLLCWLPFFLWYVITGICGDTLCPTPDIVNTLLFWIGYLNSALNPTIYACHNKQFRRAFKQLLHLDSIRNGCTSCCCYICIKRGLIKRRHQSDLYSDLPPRTQRPSVVSNPGISRNNSLSSTISLIRQGNGSNRTGFGSRSKRHNVEEAIQEEAHV